MNEDNSERVTVTLSASQLVFLRSLIEDAAAEHDRFVARVLNDGTEQWDGQWPGAAELTVRRRSDAARSVLASLEKACPEDSTATRHLREGSSAPATPSSPAAVRHRGSLGL